MASEDKKKVVGLDTVWVFKDYIDKVRGEIANNMDLSMKDYFDTKFKEAADDIKGDYDSQYNELNERLEYVEQFGTPEEVEQIRLELDALVANTNDKFDALEALNKELEILSGEYEGIKNSVFTEGQINELINAAMIDGVTITDDAVLAENVYASKLVAFIGNFAKISASQIEGGEITGHTIASSEFIPGTSNRRWQIGNEGEGWLANKQISWNANGDVTLGNKVTISYNNISGLQEEIGDLIDKAQNEGLTIKELIKLWSSDDKISPSEMKELLKLKDQILTEYDRVNNGLSDIVNKLDTVQSSLDSESDVSDDTQQEIDAIKTKISIYKRLLSGITEYTAVKDKAIETIDYYKNQFDNSNTDGYNCVQIIDEYPLEIINSYYIELNSLLKNYDKVQNFLAVLTGNIADIKINNINRILNNLEEDRNNLKEIVDETSELAQTIIDSFLNDNLISSDEQLTLKLKLDEITTEYASISESVHALIAAYEEANTPKVDENGEEHEEAFIAEDVAEYLEKLTTAFEAYLTNYNNAYQILTYYTNEATERDDFGNITVIAEYNLNDLPLFYAVRQKLLDIYYEASSYYTTYNRFGSKTTWIGEDGIYSGTIMADNLRGWCIEGLTVQSGIKSELPDDLTWYKYNGKEATDEADAFTKITPNYVDENGNPVTKGPTWQIYKDGTGHLAKGGIRWNNDEVIFGDSTKISITREDGTSELVPLGSTFSDMDDKIGGYISEWQDDNIISYTEQRAMLTVAAEINAEHKQITNSINNLIKNLREAQDKIDVDTTDSVIETYINSLNATEYVDATNKALAAIEYYTQEDPEGTLRSVTGSVEISGDYPLSDISDYYDVRETFVEKYNLAADFYTNNINIILSGVIEDVKVNAETINDYIATWTSDNVISPAELAEFRVLYNTIKSEQKDITTKISKLDKQYEELIATINDENTVLKSTLQDYKDRLNATEYNTEAEGAINTLKYYINAEPNETGFIDIVDDKPIQDLYDYYVIKDNIVNNYNNAFAAYTTYTNGELVERINNISTTNENIDKFIADWADNNNVDPAEQVQMEYVKKEIIAEEPVIKAAAALTLENVLDVEDIIINNGIEDDILLNTTSKYKNSLDITVATSDIASYDAKKNLALDVISYYTSSTEGSFVDIVTEKPLSAIDDYYAAREQVKNIVNEANSFCTGYNSGNFKDILNKLSDTNEKITSYIEAWLDDNGIDPAEQTEMEYIRKEIVAETPTLITVSALSISNLAAVEKKINDSEITEDDELLTNIENIKKRLDSTVFADASSAAQRVINYYVNSKKDSNGFIAFNEKYPLADIDNYYTERENLTQAINEADSLCQAYNDIAINNVIGGLSDTDTKITEYIATWKDDKLISPAERSELGRILSEILVEEAGVIASVNDITDKLNDILTTDGDKIGNDIKYELNEIIDTLDTTTFKTAADNAETVLQYYTTTANIENNGFIKIIEDQKLEVVEIYYKEREAIKNNYNVALSFYNAYNKSSINILNKDLEDYAKKMDEFIDAVSSDGFIDANERRQFQIYIAEIASDSKSLDAAASSLRTDLNALAATTGNMYITEINKHLDAISIGILGFAESALNTLDYYINATPDKNNLVKIDGAKSLDSINRYYSKAAELNGALNAASSFHARTVGDYSNKKITVAQEKLAQLETNLRTLENLQGTNTEEVNNWIKAWIDDGTLNSEELKELRLKYDDISAEYSIVNPAIENTLSWLNAHKNDTINNEEINDYLNKLNSAHTAYINAFTAVKNTIDYYFGDEAIKDPDTGCVQISDAHPLDVFSTCVSARENAVTINNEVSTFVTTYNRFGSKLTKLTDEGIYTGTLSADKIDGWCLRGLTFQSAENAKTQVPNNVKWYEYNPEAAEEKDAFTERTGGSGAPRWQIYKDGSGYLADGQISWQGDNVSFGEKITLSADKIDGGTIKGLTITDTGGGSSFTIHEDGRFNLGEDALRYDGSKLEISGDAVHINGDVKINGKAIANGIENADNEDKQTIGELVAEYVTADQIFGKRIAGLSVESDKTVQLPNELDWQKYDETENEFVPTTGGKGPAWQIYNDGSGYLSNGHISWDAAGELSANINGSFSGGNDGTVGEDVMTWDKNNIYFKKNVVFDDDCVLTWGSNGGTSSGSEKPGAGSGSDAGLTDEEFENKLTTIGSTWIETTDVTCKNLTVQKLNTTGKGINNNIVATNNTLNAYNTKSQPALTVTGNAFTRIQPRKEQAISSGSNFGGTTASGASTSKDIFTWTVSSTMTDAKIIVPDVKVEPFMVINGTSTATCSLSVNWYYVVYQGSTLYADKYACGGGASGSASGSLSGGESSVNIYGNKVTIPGFSISVTPGYTYKVKCYTSYSVQLPSGLYTSQVNTIFEEPLNITSVYGIDRTDIGENGFRVCHDSSHIVEFAEYDNSGSYMIYSDNYGIKISDTAMFLKLANQWYRTGVKNISGTGNVLTLTSVTEESVFNNDSNIDDSEGGYGSYGNTAAIWEE